MVKKLHIYIVLTLLNVNLLKGQSKSNFDVEFDKFKNDAALKHSSFELVVSDVKSGKLIFAFNPEISLTPASTLKVITTACSLQLMGENYTYKTYIAVQGTIIDSVLNGSLLILGSGDPSLGSTNFVENAPDLVLKSIVEKVKSKGIKFINGNIIADVELFDDAPTPPNWLWTDIGNYFGAGPAALNYADNKVEVYFKSGKNPGDSTYLIKTEPRVAGLSIINNLTTGQQGSGDNCYFYGAEFQNLRVARGTIPPLKESFKVECSIPDASLFMMQQLKNQLIASGIKVSGEPTTSRILRNLGIRKERKYNVIDSLVSPPLSKIVYFTNIKSSNLYAESLLKLNSLIVSKQGNLSDGLKTTEQFLKNIGINTEGLKITDGSGLSPMNKITGLQQVQLLNYMNKQSSSQSFINSLPVAGKSGSIASMFKGTNAEGNLRAKSGYINGVRSYCGYYTNKNNELHSFSFIVNNYDLSAGEMKRKMEQIMIKLVEEL
jgi:D-alanyl-D-alanine carboxypeptidase/D-alanyl-D-alanine-endopeptidase (penicillin-binding protein 4)